MVSRAINAGLTPPAAAVEPDFELVGDPTVVRELARMAPIALDEMDGVRLLNRVDTKFAIHESFVPALLESIAQQYRVLEAAGSRRTRYTTLYFDTVARASYREHHNGKAFRQKFRMRRYGSSGPAFFEVKLKTNKGRTIKQRIPIGEIALALEGDAALLAKEVSGHANELAPSLWTAFTRITLVGRTIAERVTLDADLQFRAPNEQLVGLPGVVILEVKRQRSSERSPILQRMRDLRVAPVRVSKYCVGSALLDPGLKRNRFKPILRLLDTLTN